MTGAVVLGALALGACSRGEAESYSSPRAVAAALSEEGVRCDGFTKTVTSRPSGAVQTAGAPSSLVRSSARCDIQGHSARIFVFADESARDDWVAVAGEFEDSVVIGPQWAVAVPSPTEAETVADALGASISQ